MVEKDLYNYLVDDAELSLLLNLSSTNTKIYPVQLPFNTTMPCIVYKVVDDSTLDENIYNSIIQYDCISDSSDMAKLIRDRVQELLHIENNIRDVITYGYYFYLYSNMESSFSYKEPELNIFHNFISFSVKYIDLYGFLLQENSFYLLQENGFNFRIA
jgi:hypothetical protein